MKKVNFKKLTNQFLAGVFALTLMGGVMLNTQDVEAQKLNVNELKIGGGKHIPCASSIGAASTNDDDANTQENSVISCSTCCPTQGVSTNDNMIGSCKSSKCKGDKKEVRGLSES